MCIHILYFVRNTVVHFLKCTVPDCVCKTQYIIIGSLGVSDVSRISRFVVGVSVSWSHSLRMFCSSLWHSTVRARVRSCPHVVARKYSPETNAESFAYTVSARSGRTTWSLSQPASPDQRHLYFRATGTSGHTSAQYPLDEAVNHKIHRSAAISLFL